MSFLKNLEAVDLGEEIHYLREDHPHEIGEGIANWNRWWNSFVGTAFLQKVGDRSTGPCNGAGLAETSQALRRREVFHYWLGKG